MAMNSAVFVCDGCNKTAPAQDGFPSGWLHTPSLVIDRVVACSGDCVHAAKEEVKRRARERLVKTEARIDAVKLVRG